MIDVIAITVGVLGAAFGVRCYLELWRWARQCQNARIAIAHKRKVQLTAPLTEWLTWANQLSKDESINGRIVYRNAHVSVAIYRPQSSRKIRSTLQRVRSARLRRRATTTA